MEAKRDVLVRAAYGMIYITNCMGDMQRGASRESGIAFSGAWLLY